MRFEGAIKAVQSWLPLSERHHSWERPKRVSDGGLKEETGGEETHHPQLQTTWLFTLSPHS